jgi:Protein of unknown function (DUF1360)
VVTVQQTPPYSTYAALIGVFGAGMAGLGAMASLAGRRPEQLTPLDFAVLSAATFKASRTVAHDEEPVEDGGARQAFGELLTCSRCIGMWAAAGVVALHTIAPRTGRLFTWSLAAAAANDVLQAGFAALTSKANELEQRAVGG